MRKYIFAFLALVCLIFSLLAAEKSHAAGNHPCKQILASCQRAGYYIGGAKENKGAYYNCLNPLIEGKSVSGVTAEATIIAACKAKPHPCLKIEEACETAGFTLKGHTKKQAKGLGKDCLTPILNGQGVAGVSIDATTAAECKAIKDKAALKK